MLVFTIYNASVNRWYTTRNNKFLTKILTVAMLLHLTFAMTKVQIKLLSHFFPNSNGWLNNQQFSARDVCTSILLHMMNFDKVFKFNLIKF